MGGRSGHEGPGPPDGAGPERVDAVHEPAPHTPPSDPPHRSTAAEPPSRQLRDCLQMEAARLESARDPLTVTRHVGDLYAMLHVELKRVAAVRIRAVRTLRAQGWSYDRIAHASGLSKARVAQLVRDTRPVVPANPDPGRGRLRPGSPEPPG